MCWALVGKFFRDARRSARPGLIGTPVGAFVRASPARCTWVRDGWEESIEWMRYCWDKVCKVALYRACSDGDVPCLRALWGDDGDPWADAIKTDQLAGEAAARGGQVTVLEWAWEHGCQWADGTGICRATAGGGHLGVLQWAREHGCPWDAGTCLAAAGGGHVGVLQWAREHGCHWVAR